METTVIHKLDGGFALNPRYYDTAPPDSDVYGLGAVPIWKIGMRNPVEGIWRNGGGKKGGWGLGVGCTESGGVVNEVFDFEDGLRGWFLFGRWLRRLRGRWEGGRQVGDADTRVWRCVETTCRRRENRLIRRRVRRIASSTTLHTISCTSPFLPAPKTPLSPSALVCSFLRLHVDRFGPGDRRRW